MQRLLPFVIVALAVLMPAAQARTVVVTDANNEKSVTLSKGDTLVIRLTANLTTGYSWNIVRNPLDDTLRLLGKPHYIQTPHPPGIVGGGGTQVFRFTVADAGSGGWLRLLSLSSFEPGIKDADLWEINYTVRGTAKAATGLFLYRHRGPEVRRDRIKSGPLKGIYAANDVR